MHIKLSLIVPVYNRPDEIRELLESLLEQSFMGDYEVVIVEDGSKVDSKEVISKFEDSLEISYYFKSNTGPGDSRNYGMQRANGNYFIILDSDCILPSTYLEEVNRELNTNFVHCFGGPDAADSSFTVVQKAINYVMTSFWTTGGIRGGKKAVGKFQPRSFNMGISREAFQKNGWLWTDSPWRGPRLDLSDLGCWF